MPHNPYYSVHNGSKPVVGFCCFGHEGQVPGGNYSTGLLDIGLGLRPDLTGSGNGHEFLAAILCFADRLHAPAGFRVSVAEFNKRAIRLYEKAGFRTDSRFSNRDDGKPFLQMSAAKHAIHR
jgi:RimJ/RimL family protein N-acetyltransferase